MSFIETSLSTSTMVTNKSWRCLKLFSFDFPLKIGKNDVSHDKKNIDQLLDVLDLDLIVDVHHGDQQVPEVPKTILIRFPFKK